MARSLWKGSLSFGLVSIPIELHTAVRDNRPRFRMLHAHDRSPIRFERVCQREGEPVAWEDLVKGYEYEKGRFVVLTREDFKAAALEKSRTIDILDFVPSDEVDDRYFETSYYLVPGKGGDRAYALLREAMREEQRVAVAKFILRDTQHLAAISVWHDALVLTIMRFADEVVPETTYEFPAGKKDVRPQEMEMARLLIGNLAAGWDPAKYTDEYRENLMRIIKGKVKGKEVTLVGEAEPQQAEVIDLMERLRRSLGGAAANTRAARPAKAERTKARATGKSGKKKKVASTRARRSKRAA
jgi:DNA end-binding protein Ku